MERADMLRTKETFAHLFSPSHLNGKSKEVCVTYLKMLLSQKADIRSNFRPPFNSGSQIVL